MIQPRSNAIVLFDGVCNFCNAGVNFVIERDKHDYFRFAPLQSESARQIMTDKGLAIGSLDTLLLYEGDTIYTRSTAALRIARRLSGGWRLLYMFMVVPRPIRDFVYNIIAKNRYRLFGKKESCAVPTPERRAKYL